MIYNFNVISSKTFEFNTRRYKRQFRLQFREDGKAKIVSIATGNYLAVVGIAEVRINNSFIPNWNALEEVLFNAHCNSCATEEEPEEYTRIFDQFEEETFE